MNTDYHHNEHENEHDRKVYSISVFQKSALNERVCFLIQKAT